MEKKPVKLATAASVSAMKQFDLSSISHTDLNHNSFYRGKDLTTYFTSGEMSKAISLSTSKVTKLSMY